MSKHYEDREPTTAPHSLAPFDAGEFANLNMEALGSFAGVGEAEGEVNAALGEFAALKPTAKISSIRSAGRASIPESGRVNPENRGA